MRIDKGIPIPSMQRGQKCHLEGGRGQKWFLIDLEEVLDLEEDDSILLTEKEVTSLRGRIAFYNRRNNTSFNYATERVEGGYYRFWRVFPNDKRKLEEPKHLTQTVVRELLNYNPETGELFWRERDRKWFPHDRFCRIWNTRFAGKKAFGFLDANGYLVGSIFNHPYYAHRIIWLWVHGYLPKEVDWENGVRNDNRIVNLRLKSKIKFLATNRSGTTGVCFDTVKKKWKAYIKVGGRSHHLGNFTYKDDAIKARKAGEMRYGFVDQQQVRDSCSI